MKKNRWEKEIGASWELLTPSFCAAPIYFSHRFFSFVWRTKLGKRECSWSSLNTFISFFRVDFTSLSEEQKLRSVVKTMDNIMLEVGDITTTKLKWKYWCTSDGAGGWMTGKDGAGAHGWGVWTRGGADGWVVKWSRVYGWVVGRVGADGWRERVRQGIMGKEFKAGVGLMVEW